MIAPETDEKTARFRARRFPHQRESNEDIAKRTRRVRVQTVNADFAVQKSGSAHDPEKWPPVFRQDHVPKKRNRTILSDLNR
jgi:hypothetical protein